MSIPLLPPRLLALLDALHLRVPLRTAVFGTIDFYRRLRIPFIRRTIRRLEARKRAELCATGRKIKVCFACCEKSQWGMQSIYDAMANSPSFDPSVLVCNDWMRHGENDPQKDLLKFFLEKGMKTIDNLDESDLPDILFVPYFDQDRFGGKIIFHAIYKKVLCCVVMYSWIITNSDKHFWGNRELVYFWKNFVFNTRELEVSNSLLPKCCHNAVCLGFPRNDEFLSRLRSNDTRTRRPHKRIIWAPHWSVLTHSHLGNFDRYAYPMLDWLRKHPDVEIVLKPHPLLKARLTSPEMIQKLSANNDNFQTPETFKTEEEYDKFITAWTSLPNGSLMDSGDYSALFNHSDAMVLDSVSFIAEYMVFNKPMCFCNRSRSICELKHVFNNFGAELLEGMDISNTWEETTEFLTKLIHDVDTHHEQRAKLVEKYLSYNKKNVGISISNHVDVQLHKKSL